MTICFLNTSFEKNRVDVFGCRLRELFSLQQRRAGIVNKISSRNGDLEGVAAEEALLYFVNIPKANTKYIFICAAAQTFLWFMFR